MNILFQYISLIFIEASKNNKIKMSKSSSSSTILPCNEIIDVYADNFIKEIKHLSSLLDEYNYIGMDTEFPGTVYCLNNYSPNLSLFKLEFP